MSISKSLMTNLILQVDKLFESLMSENEKLNECLMSA